LRCDAGVKQGNGDEALGLRGGGGGFGEAGTTAGGRWLWDRTAQGRTRQPRGPLQRGGDLVARVEGRPSGVMKGCEFPVIAAYFFISVGHGDSGENDSIFIYSFLIFICVLRLFTYLIIYYLYFHLFIYLFTYFPIYLFLIFANF
jgi:hypothetical protein